MRCNDRLQNDCIILKGLPAKELSSAITIAHPVYFCTQWQRTCFSNALYCTFKAEWLQVVNRQDCVLFLRYYTSFPHVLNYFEVLKFIYKIKYYYWCYTAHLKFWHVLKEHSVLSEKNTNTSNYTRLKAFVCFTEKTPTLSTKSNAPNHIWTRSNQADRME